MVPIIVISDVGHKKTEYGGMFWPQTDKTHNHAQSGLPDNGRAIKELIVCWVFSTVI